jgi:hypothetical protein
MHYPFKLTYLILFITFNNLNLNSIKYDRSKFFIKNQLGNKRSTKKSETKIK